MNIAATVLPSSVTMWEPANSPDELTVLRRADGQAPVAGKIVRRDAVGEIKVKDTGGGAVFHVGRASFATFDDMLESVRALAGDALSFTISGAPKIGLLNADGSAKTIVRRKTTFRDTRRSVAVFDL